MLKVSVAPGWGGKPDTHVLFSPKRTNELNALITAPSGLPKNEFIRATAELNGQKLEVQARLKPIPKTLAQHLTAAPPMTANEDEPLWRGLNTNVIDPTRVWQGKVQNTDDCSAVFRMGHFDRTLFIEVRVSDDRVVSNIAPDDIKGHWRSDSVELCLDPAGEAEHTFGCYKLGIFPFDSAGHVRAARDADANPGLAEKTAPGTRLVSWKTPGGYALRVAIPFSEVGIKPEEERRFGFNVLIYDGDKADAALGENINKSRLAWSPVSGVQGRPRYWGRADIE
jgi:hypothetical protein